MKENKTTDQMNLPMIICWISFQYDPTSMDIKKNSALIIWRKSVANSFHHDENKIKFDTQ